MREGPINSLGVTHYIEESDGTQYLYTINLTKDSRPARILENGHGWILRDKSWVPVTFYVVDILYRLDLQGKLP